MQSKDSVKKVTMRKLGQQKKAISVVFIILLIIQIVIFYGVTSLGDELALSINSMENMKAETAEVFVSQTVREQMRIMLDSTRQTWVQYLEINPDIELILKVDCNYVYGTPMGDKIVFDPNTMDKRKCDEAYYNIYEKGTNKILAEKVRPIWNEYMVKQVLSIVATSLKAFGSQGFPIIYDAYTGEIIVEESGVYSDAPTVLQENGKRNLSLLWKHPNCLNPDAYKSYVDKLMIRRDTDKSSNLISLFSEPNIKDIESAGDFSKYPFGNYNRQFTEKMILPYESVGIEGQEMQIMIALSASEQDLYSSYKSVEQIYDSNVTRLENKTSKSLAFPIVSVGISLVTILLAMFMIRLFAYRCKVCNPDAKEDDC